MRRQRELGVYVAAFVVVLGVPDGALGVLWPSLRDAFHRPLGDLGVLFVVATLFYLLGGVVFGPLAQRAGLRVLVIASCASSALCCLVWAAAGAWTVVLAAVAGFGFGRGLLDAAGNAGVSDDIRRLGWLHAGWSIGGAAGPLLVAALTSVASWRLPVLAMAAAAVLITATGFVTRKETVPAPMVEALSSDGPAAQSWSTLIVLAAFMTYTAAEAGPTAWAYVYLTEGRQVSGTQAAVIVAAFWIALTLGRIALGVVGNRLSARRTISGSCVGFTAALMLLWLAPAGAAWVALPAAGAATAAVFPVLVNATRHLVGTDAEHRTIGFAIGAAAIGGPVAVYVEGVVADHLGASSLGLALVIASLPLIAVAGLLRLRLPP